VVPKQLFFAADFLPEGPVTVPVKESDRDAVNDLQLEEIQKMGGFGALFITRYSGRGFIPEKAGDVFLGEAVFPTVEPQAVWDFG